jgi:hypothetical protein
MSEHEGALFDAVLALAETLLEMGADPAHLQTRLSKARDAADALGNRNGAETLDFLMRVLFKTPDPLNPSDPSPKPSFRVV